MIQENINSKGFVDIVVTDLETNEVIERYRRNTVLLSGKTLMARSLAGEINDPFDFYVYSMEFGVGGLDGSTPKTVSSGLTSLYLSAGVDVLVGRSWSNSAPTQAVFTGTLNTATGNGLDINEAALKTANGELFSMITFPPLSKTSNLQITLNWTIVFS